MNDLVEECRREWKRLRVPDQVADEMAADLAADLEEAQAEGASAEDVLGSAARDPRSFAAAWAAERGVIGRSPAAGRRVSLIPATIAVLALIAVVGAVLLIRASAPERRALVVPAAGRLIRAPAPERRVLLLPPPAASAERQLVNGAVWVSSDVVESLMRDTSGSSGDTRTVGAVLSTVALAGIVLLAFWSLWLIRSRRSRADAQPSRGA